MGKVKRVRQKFHTAAIKDSSQNINNNFSNISSNTLPMILPSDNLFAGVHISYDKLNKTLLDDTRSVKSFKSSKTDLGSRISKKDKVKLKHDILLQKIDTVNQFKKQQKERKKRKNNAIIGDTNSLHDALPSLDSLLKTREYKISVAQTPKKKAVAKQLKRKKSVVDGVKIYEKILKNKTQKDPMKYINELVKQRLENGSL